MTTPHSIQFEQACSWQKQMGRDMKFPTMWYVRPAKPHRSLRICAVWSEPLLVAWIFYEFMYWLNIILSFLSLKGSCTGSSESIHVKMPHCLNLHVVTAQITYALSQNSDQTGQVPRVLTYGPRHVISNNMAFLQAWNQMSLCSFLLSLEHQMMFGQ